jgi:hypothetical protein
VFGGVLHALSRQRSPSVSPRSSLIFRSRKDLTMLQSHIIDIDGNFVGAAIRLDIGYRFVATDMKLGDLDGSVFPTLADVHRLARRAYMTGRVAPFSASTPTQH